MFKEKESMIEKECEIVNSTFGIYTKIGHHSTLENVVMQDYSYCEPFCIIQNAIISKYCDIARNVRIGATQHPLNRATTHHMTYRRRMYDMEDEDDEVFLTARKEKMTIIGPDVWIGHGAVIQAGVKIGTGAVVGSLSVVTKDVPPYAIVAGVPAKIIRYRLEPEIQEKMMKIAWWNWPDSIIRKRFKDFCIDAKEFVEKYGE